MDDLTRTQHGVRYPNGAEDWDVERTFGSIATPFQRQQFQEQYDTRLAALGIPSVPLTFLCREVTETAGPVREVIDPPVEAVAADGEDGPTP